VTEFNGFSSESEQLESVNSYSINLLPTKITSINSRLFVRTELSFGGALFSGDQVTFQVS
jgi:hypothetical protein